MRRVMPNKVARSRVINGPLGSTAKYGFNGLFMIQYKGRTLRVLCSDGDGWDHVSVSLSHRCPTWAEMCYIKDLFFSEDETVIQYHPAKEHYVNFHPHVLHLWRKQGQEYELPPYWMIGPKNPLRS